MVNEFNADRTKAEAIIDELINTGHTDANISAYLKKQVYNLTNQQLMSALIVQMLDRIESLEAP